jgi:hypothetical protein
MEKQAEKTTASSQFLKTDRGKTKSNAIKIPSIILPKGAGTLSHSANEELKVYLPESKGCLKNKSPDIR